MMDIATSPADSMTDDRQAALVARLVELTTRVSFKPLPTSTITKLSRELNRLEVALQPTSAAIPASNSLHCQSHLANKPDRERPTISATGPTASLPKTSISASPRSGLSWSIPGGSIVMTRPTTADSSKDIPPEDRPSERVNRRMDGKSERPKDDEYELFDRRSGSPLEPPICDSSKKILKDITRLVAELQLRHEESRHIHELNLSKNQTVTHKLDAAEKEAVGLRQRYRDSTLQLAELDTTIHRLTLDMASIDKKLDKLIADCRVDKIITSPTVEAEMTFLANRVEMWRRDCAAIASKMALNVGMPEGHA